MSLKASGLTGGLHRIAWHELEKPWTAMPVAVVYGLSFSHDGRLLAAAAADGRVRVWSVT